jgi:ketosteroid isomerase-like protein
MVQDYSRDRIALQDLMLNYAAAVDERDFERYKDCFAEDVQVFNFGTGTYRGREDWLEYVWSALEKYQSSQHLLGPQLAYINGDEAQTRSDVQATHFLKGDEGTRITLWATYKTDMWRFDGEWKITRHELVVRGNSTD